MLDLFEIAKIYVCKGKINVYTRTEDHRAALRKAWGLFSAIWLRAGVCQPAQHHLHRGFATSYASVFLSLLLMPFTLLNQEFHISFLPISALECFCPVAVSDWLLIMELHLQTLLQPTYPLRYLNFVFASLRGCNTTSILWPVRILVNLERFKSLTYKHRAFHHLTFSVVQLFYSRFNMGHCHPQSFSYLICIEFAHVLIF